jgi:hypothetical protein
MPLGRIADVILVRLENPLSVRQDQIGPKRTHQNIDKGDHLLPREATQALNMADTLGLTLEERGLHQHRGGMRFTLDLLQQTAVAARTGRRRKTRRCRERSTAQAGIAVVAPLYQDSAVVRADRHPSDQP